MARTRIDWPHHIAAFRASSQSIAEYCSAAGLNTGTFGNELRKQHKPKKRRSTVRFKEFTVVPELVIARSQDGRLSLSGFDAAQLPQIVGAWSNALS